MIDGDYFANAAAIGLSPMIGDSVPHTLKKYLGRVGYLVWAIRCFFRFSPFRLSVDDGTRVRRLWSTEVRIFNGRLHGAVQLTVTTDGTRQQHALHAVTGRSPDRPGRC